MKTEFGLLAAFGDSVIPVSDVCEVFFNCKKKTANQRIKAFTFPVPAFSLMNGDRNEYFVTTEDLAAYIDEKFAVEDAHLRYWRDSFTFVLLHFAYAAGRYCDANDSQISSSSEQ